MSKDGRYRNWLFIVYPESAPSDWRSVIDELLVEWVESPLHDKDVNPDGTQKKPHWHVLLLFSGSKSYEQILEITHKVCGSPPVSCSSARGTIRYFAHLDNPEKAQYSQSDIIPHQGADLLSYLKPTSAMKYQYYAEMIEYIEEQNLTEFCDLFLYAKNERHDDWFPILCDRSSTMINHLKSRRHSAACIKEFIDPSTGEMVKVKTVK